MIYKGCTFDLKRRLKEHKLGKVISTKNKRPIKLIFYEAYLLKADAKRREKFLKTTEGRKLLRQQLRDILIKNNADVRSGDLKGSPDHSIGRRVG